MSGFYVHMQSVAKDEIFGSYFLKTRLFHIGIDLYTPVTETLDTFWIEKLYL
jgi:hypothetical protein